MLKNLGWRLKKLCLEVNEILLKNTKICCLGNMVEKIMHGEWKKLSGKQQKKLAWKLSITQQKVMQATTRRRIDCRNTEIAWQNHRLADYLFFHVLTFLYSKLFTVLWLVVIVIFANKVICNIIIILGKHYLKIINKNITSICMM